MSAARGLALFGLVIMSVAQATSASAAEQPGLVVHEWGTFTTLQSEQGIELGGVNVDDEPVPGFVHNLGPWVLRPALLTSRHWRFRSKQTPLHHPEVTMRLETPVIYFYPPPGASSPLSLDVHVRFRGGWLTEFYPKADPVAPGITDLKPGSNREEFRGLTRQTVSSLSWVDLKVGAEGRLPETDWPVWLAPRKVAAATVTARSKESEKYLFYRGVAHLRAPLKVSTDVETNTLSLRANFDEVLKDREKAPIRQLWLAHIRDDGTAAFRSLGAVEATADPQRVMLKTSASFAPQDFKTDGIARLKTEMQAELVAEGLFEDEARALLATWDKAYFQSSGLRLFFATPRRWTDHYLPLSVSSAAHLERVMIARIELITPEQRKLLKRIGDGPISGPAWIDRLADGPEKRSFEAGHGVNAEVAAIMPADYRDYISLGRFRNALATWYAAQQPQSKMKDFVSNYQLDEY